MLGLGALLAVGELVVDPAVIDDAPLAIEHEHLRRALGAEGVGHFVARVLEHGDLELVLAGEGGQLRERVLLVGVDRDKRDARCGVFACQLLKPAGILSDERTFNANENDRHRLGLLQVVELELLAAKVGQLEVLDRPAQW